jgi:acylphosphatase/uncharacterized protein YoxC
MKKKLLILGDVHDVGYRPFLLGIAESLEIERFFADNVLIDGEKAVYALVDSSEEKVNAFIEIASSRFPENASVDRVEVEDYPGNVMKTENYYRYLTAMQLGKIATYGGRMLEKQDITIKEIRGVREEVGKVYEEVRGVREDVRKVHEEVKGVREEVGKVHEEVKGVREEVGKVYEEVRGVREDVRKVHEEVKGVREEVGKVHEKQDETARVIREEVGGVSSRLDRTNELLESRFERMEREIEKIKRALIKAGIEV